MSNIPSMNPEHIRFRSQSKSSNYNETQADIFHDITNLFHLSSELERELYVSNQAYEINTQFQHMHILSLQNRIYELESELERMKNESKTHTHRAYVEDFQIDLDFPVNERAHVDTTHRLLHLPITGKTVSKVYIYDEVTKEVVIPSSLKVEAFPKEKNGWLIEENDIKNAFNGNNSSYWHRKVRLPIDETPKDHVTCHLEVTLPDTMISNRDVNTLYLHPFPKNALQIDKVEYQLSGDWQLLPGWPIQENGEPIAYTHAGDLKFCFPNTQIKKIRITMTQKNWFEDNYQKVYHFGLQEVGVFHTDYQSEMGRFEIPFILRGDTENHLITGIKPKFSNESLLTDKEASFSYNIYTIDDYDQMHYTKDSFPILVSDHRIVIKGILYADAVSGVTPALEYIELTYDNV